MFKIRKLGGRTEKKVSYSNIIWQLLMVKQQICMSWHSYIFNWPSGISFDLSGSLTFWKTESKSALGHPHIPLTHCIHRCNPTICTHVSWSVSLSLPYPAVTVVPYVQSHYFTLIFITCVSDRQEMLSHSVMCHQQPQTLKGYFGFHIHRLWSLEHLSNFLKQLSLNIVVSIIIALSVGIFIFILVCFYHNRAEYGRHQNCWTTILNHCRIEWLSRGLNRGNE